MQDAEAEGWPVFDVSDAVMLGEGNEGSEVPCAVL